MSTREMIMSDISLLPEEELTDFYTITHAFVTAVLPKYRKYKHLDEAIAETDNAIKNGTLVRYNSTEELFKSWEDEGLSCNI
jgi:hypothetical protein